MKSDFYRALNGHNVTILDFDLSSFTSRDVVPPKSKYVLVSFLFSKKFMDMVVKLYITTRHKTIFSCLEAAHAQDFLLVFPINGLDQHMSLIDYCTIFRCVIMITLFPFDEFFHVCCKKCLDTFGELVLHWKELTSFKST